MARIAIEEFLNEDVVVVFDDDILEVGQDTDEAFNEATDDIELTGALVGTAAALESLVCSIRQNGIPDNVSRAYLHQAIQSHLSQLGLEHLYIRPSFENYDDLDQEQIIASLEGIITNIWNTVSNASSKAMKSITDFFKDFVEDVYEIASKAEALKRDLQRREDTPTKTTIDISQAHMLHLSGRTDKAAIIKGFENLCKTNSGVFPQYIDNVKKFYDVFFKQRQALAGRITGLGMIINDYSVFKDFVDNVNKAVDVVLNTDNGRLELSGGRVFNTRGMVNKGLPELMKKNYNLKVDSYQTIDTLNKKELNYILDLIISNADVVKSYWKRYNDLSETLSRARADAAEDSENIDNAKILKLLARFGTHVDLSFLHFDLLQPLNALSWHTLHVSRSMLRVCSKNIRAYPVTLH